MTDTTSAEVRKEDQNKINEFGRLNKRLHERRAEIKQLKADMERTEDASTELMMLEDGKAMLFVGESFIEVSEEYATEYCENKTQEIKAVIDGYAKEEEEILKRQDELKKELYSRFGTSINLEN